MLILVFRARSLLCADVSHEIVVLKGRMQQQQQQQQQQQSIVVLCSFPAHGLSLTARRCGTAGA
jgi:CTP:molybdopterin cytidylyltransferase MocA